MIKWIILAVISVALGLFCYLYFYLGFAKPVTVEVAQKDALYLLYREHLGPYFELNSVIVDVEKEAMSRHWPCLRTFGEYLDDPEAMDPDRLRSHGGCVLNNEINEALPKEFHFEVKPPARYVRAIFTGSPAISPMRVYPQVKKFIAEQRLQVEPGVIEIYSINGDEVSTEYLFLLR